MNGAADVSRSKSNSQANPPSTNQKGRCAQLKEWVKLNPRETAFIAVNAALVLGVVLMGIIGSTTGHGISFQDMVSEKGWIISAIAGGSLIGADLLVVGANKLYKARQKAKVEAESNDDKPFDAPAPVTDTDPIPAAPAQPRAKKKRN